MKSLARCLLLSLGAVLVFVATNASQQQTGAALVKSYAGKLLLLRGEGDNARITIPLSAARSYRGQCDVAVTIASASLAVSQLQFELAPIATAEVQPAHANRCASFPTAATLTISGFGPHPSTELLSSAVSKVLLTPEQLLESYGITPPATVENPETPLAAANTVGLAPPKPLLSVYANYTAATRRAGITGDVVVEATVGRDGRLYQVNLINGLDASLDQRVLSVMSLWRFQPAEVDGAPVALVTNIVTTFRLR